MTGSNFPFSASVVKSRQYFWSASPVGAAVGFTHEFPCGCPMFFLKDKT